MEEHEASEGRERTFVDYRFVLANERTFLAWVRTALGVVAGGVALDQFVDVQGDEVLMARVAQATILMGAVLAVIGTLRWSRADVRMRSMLPMPRSRGIPIVGFCVALIACVVALILMWP